MLSFRTEMIAALFLWGNVFLRGELQKNEKIQILTILKALSIRNQGVCLYVYFTIVHQICDMAFQNEWKVAFTMF